MLQQSGFEEESEKPLPGPWLLSCSGCCRAHGGVEAVNPSPLRLKEQL